MQEKGREGEGRGGAREERKGREEREGRREGRGEEREEGKGLGTSGRVGSRGVALGAEAPPPSDLNTFNTKTLYTMYNVFQIMK